MPNFSFEQYSICPNAADQIQYAVGWSKYSIAASTPDYYNACATATSMGVPKSDFINQNDHRNCSAYAALIIWGATVNDREHIGVQLTQPLVIGQKYFLSFYTVMTESYFSGTYYGMPSNNIGLRLSTVSYNPSTPIPFNNFAHLNSSSVINDSVNWTRVTGSIIADSAYKYVILGNFFDDANTITLPYSCGSCLDAQCYYLYDDVCVSTDSLLANGGIDAMLCTVSVPEINESDKIKVFPNPSNDFITISFQAFKGKELILTDMFGKIFYSEKTNNQGPVTLNVSSYPSGMYFLKIIDQNGAQVGSKKINKL
ncbi:MAG: T9SS type A sorting domain-containing protein [Sphingobacteriaceae bacterium]|nr:T9SS type A sorting domain-containing protein [Sphingobacteriaceae bacterium]MBK7816769.1 T9SS type A sorting domain-containing protein [Sphingobacteriaceae bacterium]